MDYATTHIIFFSPTHTSAKIARSVAEGIGMGRRIETDLTYDQSKENIVIENAVAVIAVPVYAGRVAPIAKERLNRIKGCSTPAILIVVYGNRDYEDALVELRDWAVGNGFIPLSAGAFIGEHSYSRPELPIAVGRPDGEDERKAEYFGRLSLEKLHEAMQLEDISSFYIKGNIPYREVSSSIPVAPITLEEKCGVCEECIEICPTKAIYINEEGRIDTDKYKCIKCCACVKECPTGARIFNTPYTAVLHEKFSARREPETFF